MLLLLSLECISLSLDILRVGPIMISPTGLRDVPSYTNWLIKEEERAFRNWDEGGKGCCFGTCGSLEKRIDERVARCLNKGRTLRDKDRNFRTVCSQAGQYMGPEPQ